eukprot:CAMPEP_0114681884 /NCGR_PEP_ID=MMETSP0191-20121206/55910_1 /TAXON_ID=126664 /ORGANISM="Sorites sp." /LENGTH=57 /DNA_ID=CAMNT_0001960785 /DNA_START=52 /DNA_END=225 /DNA_ORIENTATION=-
MTSARRFKDSCKATERSGAGSFLPSVTKLSAGNVVAISTSSDSTVNFNRAFPPESSP